MKRIGIKFISLAMILVFMFATTACTNNSSQSETSSSSTSNAGDSSSTQAASADPFGKYDPTITIKAVRTLDSTIKFDESLEDTKSLESNVWSKAYEDMLGIKLDYLWTPAADQYATKWNTSIASNDLPDMGWVDANTYKSLLQGGLVEDMTDAFDKYASDYYKEQVKIDGAAQKFMTINGKLMGLPLTGATPDGINLLYIRKDWLEKVNLPEPKTIDELLNVAKAFKDAKLGGADTSGFCMGPYVFGGQGDWEGFLNGFGAYVGIWLKDSSGKLAYSSIQPEMRTALLKLQQAYKDGLIPKDFSVNSNPTEALVSGKAGIAYGTYWAPVVAIQDQMNKDPNSVWEVLPLPTVDGSPMKTQAWGDGLPTSFFFVKKGYEHPEAAVKIVNLGFKLDVEQYMKYNFNQATQIQVQSYRLVAAWEPWRNLNSTIKVWDAMTSKDTSKLNDGELDSYNNITSYHAGTPDRAKLGYVLINDSQSSSYSIIKQLRDENRIVLSEYKALPTDRMSQKQTLLDTNLTNAMIKVIGGGDISGYDEAAKAWLAGGGQAIADEVNAWFEQSK